MSSFGCQSVYSLSDHVQNDFLINSFFNGTSISKNEASLFPPLTLDATAPSYTWDQQKHQQQNQEFFSSLFPYEMVSSTQNSPEEALNMLLFEHQQVYPHPTPSAQTIPEIHFYNSDNSNSMITKFDSASFGYTPLSPASMYSDSIECAVSNVSNSVRSTPFPQQLGYPDDQMPQTSYETEMYTSVMGNSNQTCLSKQVYYQPDYCYSISEDKSFVPIARQTHRRTRRKTIHPSQLQCTICSKTFSRPYNLKSHQRTHTNERPYRCTHPDCGWTFARPHDLKRHELLHSGVKPHTCSCGKKFSRRDAFKRHQTVDTGCARKKKAQRHQQQ